MDNLTQVQADRALPTLTTGTPCIPTSCPGRRPVIPSTLTYMQPGNLGELVPVGPPLTSWGEGTIDEFFSLSSSRWRVSRWRFLEYVSQASSKGLARLSKSCRSDPQSWPNSVVHLVLVFSPALFHSFVPWDHFPNKEPEHKLWSQGEPR